MKRLKCSSCGLLKLENEFSRDRYKRKGGNNRQALYGRTYDCLACIRIKRKELHKRNPQILIRRYTKRKKEYDSKKQRNAMLKSRYGISLVEYEAMLKKQNGVCVICSKDSNHKKQGCFHVDHNHKTGKVRGLLCIRCNTIIGNSKEDVDILKKAIGYIYKHLDSV